MGFGEEYQGMNDREILVEIAVNQRAMDNRMGSLESKVDRIQCPSPKCSDHERRLGKLEDHERIVVGVVCVAILGSGLLVWGLSRIFG
jgi:hypothetical protein